MSARPSPRPVPRPASRTRTAWARGAAYLALWVGLMPSPKLADLAVGALAAAGATWVSVRLLPPESGSLRFGVLLALMPHLLWESVLAGIDVARRALSPRVALNSGLVNCPLGFPPGLARNTFATITSLLPGTVPVGEGDELLVYHCLDVSQPVVEQLGVEERLLAEALVAGRRHD